MCHCRLVRKVSGVYSVKLLPGAVLIFDRAFERHVVVHEEILSLLGDADVFSFGPAIVHFSCRTTHDQIKNSKYRKYQT